jgi:hypothetical protein
MLLITYWPKDGHPYCQKGQYIQNWSYVTDQNKSLFLHNVVWDIVLPKLLFHTKPHPPPFNDIIALAIGQVCLRLLRFSAVTTIPPTLHIYLRLKTTFTRTKQWSSGYWGIMDCFVCVQFRENFLLKVIALSSNKHRYCLSWPTEYNSHFKIRCQM